MWELCQKNSIPAQIFQEYFQSDGLDCGCHLWINVKIIHATIGRVEEWNVVWAPAFAFAPSPQESSQLPQLEIQGPWTQLILLVHALQKPCSCIPCVPQIVKMQNVSVDNIFSPSRYLCKGWDFFWRAAHVPNGPSDHQLDSHFWILHMVVCNGGKARRRALRKISHNLHGMHVLGKSVLLHRPPSSGIEMSIFCHFLLIFFSFHQF